MKKFLLMATIFIVSLFFVTSCGEYDPNEMMYNSVEVTQKYEMAFIKSFGQPARNQSWGFRKRNTRVADPNGNMWEEEGYVIPPDITNKEREKVIKIFSQVGAKKYNSLLDLDCFFVQQVYKGKAKYYNHAGQKITGSDHMDWLCTVTNKHTKVVCWWPYEEEIVIGESYNDHIFNFNNGNNQVFGGRMLMVNTDSHTFGFKSSEGGGHIFYNFRMEKIDGNYYVGFDFEATGANPNEQVDRDYIYNDWIVKIVPGIPNTSEVFKTRIIGEDLSASESSDFDFNDIVMDVDLDGTTAYCKLQAAGGTLPIIINNDVNLEIHSLFGVPTTTPVNVGRGVTIDPNTRPQCSFTLYNINDVKDINISVLKNGSWVFLKAETGIPASKISVPQTFIWCNEYEPMFKINADGTNGGRYPKFREWIHDPSVKWY